MMWRTFRKGSLSAESSSPVVISLMRSSSTGNSIISVLMARRVAGSCWVKSASESWSGKALRALMISVFCGGEPKKNMTGC